MPKIEGPTPIHFNETKLEGMQNASLGWSSASTIWSYATHPFYYVIQKVKSFFSWIMSWFRKAPVLIEQKKIIDQAKELQSSSSIGLVKIQGKNGEFAIQFCVNGKPTENTLFFEKREEVLVYQGKHLPDPRFNRFILKAVRTVKKLEKASKVMATRVETIADLTLAGLEKESEVSYQPDILNDQNKTIKEMIEKGRAQRKQLSAQAEQALQRIETKLTASPPSENSKHTLQFSLSIDDLFTLRDSLDLKEQVKKGSNKEYELELDTDLGSFEVIEKD